MPRFINHSECFNTDLTFSYIPKKAEPPTPKYIILIPAPLYRPFTPSSFIISLNTSMVLGVCSFTDYVINLVFNTSKGVTVKPAKEPARAPLKAFIAPGKSTSD